MRSVTSWENATQKLFLTICELAEAGECVRKGRWEMYQDHGKPKGFQRRSPMPRFASWISLAR